MKKFLCISLALALLVCVLTGCNFTQSTSGNVGKDAESRPKTEEMLKYLGENKIAEAKGLLHPDAAATSEALEQMGDYLAGRKARSLEQINISTTTTNGTSGKTKQERVGYKLTLDDGTVIYVNAYYLDDQGGKGFVSFQLVLGII